MQSDRTVRKKALGVFLILFCMYLLSFNGVSSTDDEQLYIALTGGLASGKGYSGLPLLGNDRLQGNNGSVEPFHSLVGIPLFLLAQSLNLGSAQIFFVLPAIYTALTAMLIYRIVLRWGYLNRIALFSAIVFGLGTIAFPYARMNFREPLAALLIMLAIYLFETGKSKKRTNAGKVVFLFLAMISLGFASLTKITTLVVLPVIIMYYLMVEKWHFQKWNSREQWLGIASLGFIAIGVYLIFRRLPAESISRFTLRFADYIRYTLPRLPHAYFWGAMAAQLFSPGKGLFVYSPILILALVSPFLIKDRRWILGLAALCTLAATQALIYDEDWWGITWGTRALLPVIPLMMLSAVPAIDRLLKDSRRTRLLILLVLAVLSFLIQAGSLFASDPAYVGWATQTAGRSIDAPMQWDIRFAPFFRYAWLGMQDMVSDLAWFHLIKINSLVVTVFIGSCVALVGIALRLLFGAGKKNFFAPLSAIVGLAMIASLLNLVKTDRRYYTRISSISETQQIICEIASADDLVLIDHYLHPFWWYYSNFSCPHPSWAGLPYIHQTAIHTQNFYPRLSNTEQLALEWLQTGDVFLVTSNPNTESSYQQELGERGFSLLKISDKNFEPFIIYQITKE